MKNFKMALLAMVLVVTSVLFAACSNKEEEKKADAKDAKIEERTVQHAKGKLKFLQTQRKLLTLVVQQKNY